MDDRRLLRHPFDNIAHTLSMSTVWDDIVIIRYGVEPVIKSCGHNPRWDHVPFDLLDVKAPALHSPGNV